MKLEVEFNSVFTVPAPVECRSDQYLFNYFIQQNKEFKVLPKEQHGGHREFSGVEYTVYLLQEPQCLTQISRLYSLCTLVSYVFFF